MTRLVAFMLIIFGLAACTTPGPGQDPYPRVDGVVTYYERIGLPQNAVVEVSLLDITDPRRPYVIGIDRIFGPPGPPIAFAIDFERHQIDPRGVYEVAAQIVIDGRQVMANHEPYFVITDGNPYRDLEVVVRRIR